MNEGIGEFFGRAKMMGSWSLVLDAAVFGDEELRFPDSTEALFEFVRVEADTLYDEIPKLFARWECRARRCLWPPPEKVVHIE